MGKVNKLSFEGETIYVGLDVHKTNWKVQPRMGGVELNPFSQDPDAVLLSSYFKRNYPGAKVKVAYEAGFCGFGIQRQLTQLAIECIVVNAADVPASDKERRRKDDKRDARKLSRELAEGSLTGIYIPSPEMEQARGLVRQRYRVRQDQTRCKNRIKHMLMCNGLKPGIKGERWTNQYVQALEQLPCPSTTLREALNLALEEYRQIRLILQHARMSIGKLQKDQPFARLQPYLQSIDGVGLINAMVIQTEIQDINRFKTLDQLNDYAGFVPDISSSNDCIVVKGMSRRGNEFLQQALIESSWILVRKDPAMLLKYNQYRKRMNKNKAIIRIAKHLLSRIRYVWKNQQMYQAGLVS